jgi:hypothetical protein
LIIPYSDAYVRSKLGDPAWIPAKDRCRLSDEAIKYEGAEMSSWIAVSRGESEWSSGFVDFFPVTQNLRNFLNSALVTPGNFLKHPLRVVYVCGLDHYNKCSNVKRMADNKNISCAVVYRGGCDEQHISRSMKASGTIYVPLSKERSKLVDVSSTLIRQYFQSPKPQMANIEQHICPMICEYMSQKYRKK